MTQPRLSGVRPVRSGPGGPKRDALGGTIGVVDSMPHGATLLAIAALAGCTHTFLAPDDRARICTVALEETSALPAFHANPAFDAAGGPLIGSAIGVLGVLTLNPQFVVATVAAAACGAASVKYPTAEKDFRRIFESADPHTLTRALAGAIDAPRGDCARPRAGAPAASPDATVQIDSVDFQMICPLAAFSYSIAVKWRALSATGHRLLGEAVTRCTQVSVHEVDSWARDNERARAEVERALARTGKRIATELFAADELAACVFYPDPQDKAEQN